MQADISRAIVFCSLVGSMMLLPGAVARAQSEILLPRDTVGGAPWTAKGLFPADKSQLHPAVAQISETATVFLSDGRAIFWGRAENTAPWIIYEYRDGAAKPLATTDASDGTLPGVTLAERGRAGKSGAAYMIEDKRRRGVVAIDAQGVHPILVRGDTLLTPGGRVVVEDARMAIWGGKGGLLLSYVANGRVGWALANRRTIIPLAREGDPLSGSSGDVVARLWSFPVQPARRNPVPDFPEAIMLSDSTVLAVLETSPGRPRRGLFLLRPGHAALLAAVGLPDPTDSTRSVTQVGWPHGLGEDLFAFALIGKGGSTGPGAKVVLHRAGKLLPFLDVAAWKDQMSGDSAWFSVGFIEGPPVSYAALAASLGWRIFKGTRYATMLRILRGNEFIARMGVAELGPLSSVTGVEGPAPGFFFRIKEYGMGDSGNWDGAFYRAVRATHCECYIAANDPQLRLRGTPVMAVADGGTIPVRGLMRWGSSRTFVRWDGSQWQVLTPP